MAADDLPQPPVVAQISPAEDPADQPAAGMVLPAELHADVHAVRRFLHEDLKLELSPSKTLITHGRTRPARFLGYEVAVLQADHKHDHRGHRSIDAAIGLKCRSR